MGTGSVVAHRFPMGLFESICLTGGPALKTGPFDVI